MSPLIRKELRLILPFWGIAMFLAVAPAFVVPADPWLTGMNESIYWAFGFGAILLGLAPFGQEFSLGTFSALLAQPLERRQMWKTKLWLLLLSALLVMLAFLVAAHFRLASDLQESLERWLPAQRAGLPANMRLEDIRKGALNFYHTEFWFSCLGGGALVMLVGIAGGFWTSLLFRQTGAALWFAILSPGVILVAAEVVGHLFLFHSTVFLVPAFAIYIVGGFIWARRMFFAAQDAQWLGGTISLLSFSSAKPQTESVTARRRKPLSALLRKEFQSHQVSLIVGFGLMVLHICTLVFRRFYVLHHSSELRFAVEAVPLLWLLLPWLIGCVAVAEERRLGTLESQHCLPVARRLQFAVKLAIVMALGTTLGGIMPCIIERLGSLAGISSEIVSSVSSLSLPHFFATTGEMALAAGIIAFISFFASTLTRNTLHALGAAVVSAAALIALLHCLSETVSLPHSYYDYPWEDPLFITLVPVAILTVIWLSFSNYKLLHVGLGILLRNLLTFSVTLFLAVLGSAVLWKMQSFR
jgi:hypothetical protein